MPPSHWERKEKEKEKEREREGKGGAEKTRGGQSPRCRTYKVSGQWSPAPAARPRLILRKGAWGPHSGLRTVQTKQKMPQKPDAESQRLDVTSWSSPRRRQWHPTPVLLPGKSHGRGSLVGCSPWGGQESDTTEQPHFPFSLSCTGEGNGNPLQCSCLENPREGGAWWAAVCGVAQSRTRLE